MLNSLILLGAAFLGAEGPVYSCPRIETPIQIDGELDEAWESVEPITDFVLWETHEEPTYAVSVRLAYDDDYLYAIFYCEDTDIFTLYEERDSYLWEADVVELFFQPKPKTPIYYEFEIAPDNVIFDARFINRGSGGFRRWAQWDCDLRSAVSVVGTLNDWSDMDAGYTVELAIPLATFEEALGDEPLQGQIWDFAAVRMDFSKTLPKEERSATARVEGGNMHDNTAWSRLRFE